MFKLFSLIIFFGFWFFVLSIVVCVLIAFVRANEMANNISLILSHWSHMIEGLEASSQQFYGSVEAVFAKKNIPGAHISRVIHSESGVFSSRREYLRVKRKDHIFDICAAPFGNGFFISWWLGESLGLFWGMFLKIPFLGKFLFQLIRPMTYYRLDTAMMFQSLVHSAVLECVDTLTQANGLRPLSELTRKPVMSELFSSSSFSGK